MERCTPPLPDVAGVMVKDAAPRKRLDGVATQLVVPCHRVARRACSGVLYALLPRAAPPAFTRYTCLPHGFVVRFGAALPPLATLPYTDYTLRYHRFTCLPARALLPVLFSSASPTTGSTFYSLNAGSYHVLPLACAPFCLPPTATTTTYTLRFSCPSPPAALYHNLFHAR